MEGVISKTPTLPSESIWQTIVLRMLRKMNKGSMRITLPNNEIIEFGEGAPSVHASMVIKDYDFFKRCVLYGDVGFGEAYVDGLWDTTDITKVISWFLVNIDNAPTISGSHVKTWLVNILKTANRISNLARINTESGSRKNISEHYDLSNEFFSLFLDRSLSYSSAYFKNQEMTLEEAQYEKYKALAERVRLKSSDHVLEIGTGWGANAIFMARNYGCRVTTTTISHEQYKLAVERVEKEGLKEKITVLLKDYRALEGTFDKIVSVEMLEAVGHKFLKTFFARCHALLKKEGLLGLQVITCPDSRYENLKNGVDWIQKHIFPGSLLPSIAAINYAVNKTGDMTLLELKDMGKDYGKTLRCWFELFNQNWPAIHQLGFDDTFRRKWNYYLCYCAAAFDMRNINVMQMVYARPNNLNW
jgi:cyclopropane-fatty-acyl-phospholipid synthase